VSYPFAVSGLSVGKYPLCPLCYCYGPWTSSCATNLTASHVALGHVLLTSAVPDQHFAMLANTSAQSFTVRFVGFTPIPGQDRLMLIPADGQCGSADLAAVLGSVGSQIIATLGVGADGLQLSPTTYAAERLELILMQAGQPCDTGYWGSFGFDALRSAVQPLSGNGAAHALSLAVAAPSRTTPFRTFLKRLDGSVLDLPNVGVFVAEVTRAVSDSSPIRAQ